MKTEGRECFSTDSDELVMEQMPLAVAAMSSDWKGVKRIYFTMELEDEKFHRCGGVILNDIAGEELDGVPIVMVSGRQDGVSWIRSGALGETERFLDRNRRADLVDSGMYLPLAETLSFIRGRISPVMTRRAPIDNFLRVARESSW